MCDTHTKYVMLKIVINLLIGLIINFNNVILACVKGYDSFWIFSVNILIILYNRLVINIISNNTMGKLKVRICK